MLSTRMWKAIGVGGTALTGALLLGVTKVIDLVPDTNLLNTGITPGVIFGIWMIIVAIAIHKNRI
jgi:hypothetical protein